MYQGEKVKIELTNILIFITFIYYQYNARNGTVTVMRVCKV